MRASPRPRRTKCRSIDVVLFAQRIPLQTTGELSQGILMGNSHGGQSKRRSSNSKSERECQTMGIFNRATNGVMASLAMATVISTSATGLRAQVVTRPSDGRSALQSSRPARASYDARLLPPSYQSRYQPSDQPRYQRRYQPTYQPRYQPSYRATYPAPSSGAAQTRLASTTQSYRVDPNRLPPPPNRVYRGQEPADLRPRLNTTPRYTPLPSAPRLEYRSPSVPCQQYASRSQIVRYSNAPPIGQPTAPPYNAYQPMIPLAPMPKQYYFGRGSLGQPKVYVPGQPIRNFLRYITL